MIRRMTFRNWRRLFRRKDDYSGREIFSGIPPQAPVKVYEHDYWWSDKWDPMRYGKEYDFSKPFFEQFFELLKTVPLPSKSVINMVNSEFSDQAGNMKNSYLCFDGNNIEDSAYLVKGLYMNDCFDMTESAHDELSYEGVMIDEGYRVFYSVDCENCSDVWFSKDLVGCSDCLGCVNLRNRSYYIFNQPYGKEQYFEELRKINLNQFQVIQDLRVKAEKHWIKYPVKFMRGSRNINSSGEHIQDTKNVKYCYSIHDGENLKYCQLLWDKAVDSYDYTNWGMRASLIYESVVCGMQVSNIRFSFDCWPSSGDLEYCINCHSSSNLFGCVGLKKKEYCIFNKQYSKEEYSDLRNKIIAHMNSAPYLDSKGRIYKYGEFFPSELSLFAYNETVANDYFPLTKEEALGRGYRWQDPEAKEFETTLDARNLPGIDDATENILKEVIKCASCNKAYRIIQTEFVFLKKNNLPLPHKCPDCRFKYRFRFVNPPRFWHRRCTCGGVKSDNGVYANQTAHFHGSIHCPNEFETSYAPERPEIVYCEDCYQAEVV